MLLVTPGLANVSRTKKTNKNVTKNVTNKNNNGNERFVPERQTDRLLIQQVICKGKKEDEKIEQKRIKH